jgi:hypothetical protein
LTTGVTIREKIIDLCIKALDENPSGLRFAELSNYVKTHLDPTIKRGNIAANLVKMVDFSDGKIKKVDKGFYQMASNINSEIKVSLPATKIRESDFYEKFAEYLENDLEDCTKAIDLGGAGFGDKWATPDVIGVLRSKPSDTFKFEPEIVAAEIKTATNDLITALGQACSYRLFAHRTYIVIPKQAQKNDIDRLVSLCQIFGIGLIVFDVENRETPSFQVMTRASTHKPDMYYLNHYLSKNNLADKLLG